MPAVMSMSTSMSLLRLALVLLATSATAFDPNYNDPPAGDGDTSNCIGIEMFSVDWFLQNTCYAPPPGTCVFYTSGQGGYARQYASHNIAAGNPQYTIWDLWDGEWYDNVNVVDNPMRCIFYGPNRPSETYFRYMSQALATLCTGDVLVMDADISSMPSSKAQSTLTLPSLFYNTEFPQLMRGGEVPMITAIMAPKGTNPTVWWPKSSNLRRSREDRYKRYQLNNSQIHNPITRRSSSCGAGVGVPASFDGCEIGW